MPNKPKKPCAYPGCPNLTDDMYCEEHKAKVNKDYNRYQRNPETKKKYGNNWNRLRNRYIREHPLCEDCLKSGYYVPAAEVHHIVPVSRGGTNEITNLVALCKSCHMKRHLALGDRRVFR